MAFSPMTKRARPEGDGGDLAAAVLLPLLRLQRRKERRCLLEKKGSGHAHERQGTAPSFREKCSGTAGERQCRITCTSS